MDEYFARLEFLPRLGVGASEPHCSDSIAAGKRECLLTLLERLRIVSFPQIGITQASVSAIEVGCQLKGRPALLDSAIVLAGTIQCPSSRSAVIDGQRIQLLSGLDLSQRIVELPHG